MHQTKVTEQMNRLNRTPKKKIASSQRCNKAKVRRQQARNKLTWFVISS